MKKATIYHFLYLIEILISYCSKPKVVFAFQVIIKNDDLKKMDLHFRVILTNSKMTLFDNIGKIFRIDFKYVNFIYINKKWGIKS